MTTTVERPSPLSDAQQTEEFLGKVLGDTSGFTNTVLASLGDRTGLWAGLADGATVTAEQLAERTGNHPRYVREWLGGMTVAGYVDYDPEARTYRLPATHVPVLAEEGGPAFFGGVHQMLHGMVTVYDQLLEAFRTGAGVPQSAYHDDMWDGMERFTNGWFSNLLLPAWLPALPDVQAALERGCDVADIGSGRGRALITLAQAYPRSRFIGYDVFEPTVAQAQANADAAGVGDRVRFEHRDVSLGLPERCDVAFTFDVVHDSADPVGLLRAIRAALRPGGRYVCLEINCSDRLEDNTGPLSAFFHGASVLYCMTTSLAHGGAGLGTVGVPEPTLRELCSQAGFTAVRRADIDNPFNSLYEAS